MLLEAGVDLLLCGHLHAYERARFETVTQVMTSASDIFFEDMDEKPGEYRVAFDKHRVSSTCDFNLLKHLTNNNLNVLIINLNTL